MEIFNLYRIHEKEIEPKIEQRHLYFGKTETKFVVKKFDK